MWRALDNLVYLNILKIFKHFTWASTSQHDLISSNSPIPTTTRPDTHQIMPSIPPAQACPDSNPHRRTRFCTTVITPITDLYWRYLENSSVRWLVQGYLRQARSTCARCCSFSPLNYFWSPERLMGSVGSVDEGDRGVIILLRGWGWTRRLLGGHGGHPTGNSWDGSLQGPGWEQVEGEEGPAGSREACVWFWKGRWGEEGSGRHGGGEGFRHHLGPGDAPGRSEMVSPQVRQDRRAPLGLNHCGGRLLSRRPSTPVGSSSSGARGLSPAWRPLRALRPGRPGPQLRRRSRGCRAGWHHGHRQPPPRIPELRQLGRGGRLETPRAPPSAGHSGCASPAPAPWPPAGLQSPAGQFPPPRPSVPSRRAVSASFGKAPEAGELTHGGTGGDRERRAKVGAPG